MRRIVLSILVLILLAGIASAISPNYAELTSPVGFKNNTTTAIAFADIPKDGLVLWLTFDEGYGYTVHDLVDPYYHGTGYNGTIQQINWTVGVQGGAVKLDGKNDYIIFPYVSKLNITKAITIVFWFYSDDVNQSWRHVFGISNGTISGTPWRIRIGGIHDLYFQGYDENGNQIYFGTVKVGLTLKDYGHDWHFFAFVYDSVNDLGKIYMDGKLIWEGLPSGAGAGNPLRTANVPLTIGVSYGCSDYGNFSLDNVFVYNRALSDKEIKEIYEATKLKYDINKGLVLYLPFDEMSGSIAHDLSGHGNNGIGYNGTIQQINWTAGIFGGAVKFDGMNDYVEISGSSAINIAKAIENSGEFTVSLWIKPYEWVAPNDVGRAHWLFANANDLAIKTGGAPDLIVDYKATDDHPHWITYRINPDLLNKWFMVTYCYNNSTGYLQLYINGELVAEKYVGLPPYLPDVISATSPYIRFGFADVSGYQAYGCIDEVRIYNRALNASEIRYLYELGKSKLHLERGLVLHLTFDEGQGNVTYNYAWTNISVMSGKFYGNLSANWTDGLIGKAIEFDGVNDYVKIPSLQANLTEGTVSFWIYRFSDQRVDDYISIAGKYPLIYSGGGSNNGFQIYWYGANGVPWYSDKFYVPPNEWHMLTVTWSNITHTLTIYLDGEVIVKYTNMILPIQTNPTVYIGLYPIAHRYYWGIIDDVRIYNRVLSPEEIKALYLLTKNKYDSEFRLVNYSVEITPLSPNKLEFKLKPENELTDIQKLVFLPAKAVHSYDTISTETDDYGNKVQAVETSDESPTFTIEIPDLSPAPDGVAMAVWEYKGTLRAVADPDVYKQITIDWGIFHWILDNFTQMFIHRDNELKPGDIFEFPDVQLTIVASGYISSTDPIKKTEKGLIISGSEFGAIPDADTVIYLEGFNPEKIREGTGAVLAKFTVDTEYHDEHIKFVITNLPPNTNFTIYKNGTFLKYVVTDANGTLEFEDSGFSPTTFEIVLTAKPSVIPFAPPEIDLEGAVQYASYTLASILTFLAIALIVRKFKKGE